MDAGIFQERRRRLMASLGKHDAVLVLAPPETIRNDDVHYPYRQASDFYYLTGLSEPGSALLLRPGTEHPYTLFVRPRDPEMETWNGRRTGVEGALQDYGANQAFPIDTLEGKLKKLLAGRTTLHYHFGVRPEQDKHILDVLHKSRRGEKRGAEGPTTIQDLSSTLHEQRLIKDENEIALLRQAARITVEAHAKAMQQASPGKNEYEIASVLEHVFRSQGCSGPGYTSIVGGGENATILHYIENNQPLVDGDLLLIDAGGEFNYYTADITRTFPVNGKFTTTQKQVYDWVLKAQLAAIETAATHASLEEVHERAVFVLTQGLIELGLLDGSVEKAVENKTYRKFYMHGTSHWLGMDVHDVGNYRKDGAPRPLEPGMVFTIEPGLYFDPNDKQIPTEFRGIGIRIEDDILVTQDGVEVLTEALAKSVEEIEAQCQS